MSIPATGDRRVHDRDEDKTNFRWGTQLIVLSTALTVLLYLILSR